MIRSPLLSLAWLVLLAGVARGSVIVTPSVTFDGRLYTCDYQLTNTAGSLAIFSSQLTSIAPLGLSRFRVDFDDFETVAEGSTTGQSRQFAKTASPGAGTRE